MSSIIGRLARKTITDSQGRDGPVRDIAISERKEYFSRRTKDNTIREQLKAKN